MQNEEDALNDDYNEEEADEMADEAMESQMSVFDVDRVKRLENEMSKMYHQLDMCRQLLGMKGEVEKIKKIQNFAQKTDKQTSLNAESIQTLSDKVEAHKKKQDKQLESLDAAVRDEEATRVLEHKRIKKVAQELEKQ